MCGRANHCILATELDPPAGIPSPERDSGDGYGHEMFHRTSNVRLLSTTHHSAVNYSAASFAVAIPAIK